jgi:hypothetical protein
MVESLWRLGMYSQSICYVRRRWDIFSTQVHTVRCVWDPVATSLRARILRPSLPMALGSAILIRCREPLGMPALGPDSMSQASERGGEGRHVAKSCLPTLIVG